MSYRMSQLSPQVGTDSTNVRMIRGPWSASPESSQDVQPWRSLLEFYSEELIDGYPRRVNWNAVFGLGLTVALSCAFWTGVGLTAMHFWK